MRLFLALLFLLCMVTASHAATTATANLTWQDTSNNEDGFNVERGSSAAGPFVRIGGTLTNVTAFSDPGLSLGVTYCYRVNAFNSAGISGYSNAVCGMAVTVPSDPSGLTLQFTVVP